jgi:uncharacterized membrane protein
MNRRAKFTAVAIALITASFYICLFKKTEIAWFIQYSERVLVCLALVIGGITATDAIKTWRSGNGNGGNK